MIVKLDYERSLGSKVQFVEAAKGKSIEYLSISKALLEAMGYKQGDAIQVDVLVDNKRSGERG